MTHFFNIIEKFEGDFVAYDESINYIYKQRPHAKNHNVLPCDAFLELFSRRRSLHDGRRFFPSFQKLQIQFKYKLRKSPSNLVVRFEYL